MKWLILVQHNAEPEAVDLLMEVSHDLLFCVYCEVAVYAEILSFQVEDLDLLIEHVDATNYKRACLYLTSSSR